MKKTRGGPNIKKGLLVTAGLCFSVACTGGTPPVDSGRALLELDRNNRAHFLDGVELAGIEWIGPRYNAECGAA